jgi:hypothetical protein
LVELSKTELMISSQPTLPILPKISGNSITMVKSET